MGETWQNFVYNYSLALIAWLNFSKQIALSYKKNIMNALIVYGAIA